MVYRFIKNYKDFFDKPKKSKVLRYYLFIYFYKIFKHTNYKYLNNKSNFSRNILLKINSISSSFNLNIKVHILYKYILYRFLKFFIWVIGIPHYKVIFIPPIRPTSNPLISRYNFIFKNPQLFDYNLIFKVSSGNKILGAYKNCEPYIYIPNIIFFKIIFINLLIRTSIK